MLHVSKLRAPFGVLQQMLGPPDDEDVPDKCSTCWEVLAPGTADVYVCIQDWQDEDDPTFRRDAFRSLPSYDWDVWAPDEESGHAVCAWLSQRVIAKVQEVRTLGAEGKARVNELLRQGVPLADAMKQVKPEAPADIARRFAWPIVE